MMMEHLEKYRSMIAANLDNTHDRTMFSQAEVRDMLLDLWNELHADEQAVLVSA